MNVLNQIGSWAFGVAVVIILMSVIYKRNAVDWDQLVRVYGKAWQTPRHVKQFANMILYSNGRMAKSYKGVISIGLLDDGIALRPNRILVPFQRPIFIPYADIQGWDQRWYVDSKSTELSFRKVPHMRVIMPKDQVEWMLSLSKGAVQISEARPPHGTSPWLSRAIALSFGILTLVVLITVIAMIW